jgi:hypothetical protein
MKTKNSALVVALLCASSLSIGATKSCANKDVSSYKGATLHVAACEENNQNPHCSLTSMGLTVFCQKKGKGIYQKISEGTRNGTHHRYLGSYPYHDDYFDPTIFIVPGMLQNTIQFNPGYLGDAIFVEPQ